ncbi:MAG TPA: FecR domain-containing protein [Stellaceae bacterium]|nr:FecR domain-containing protein [Stellaceae bacterium]
MFRSAWLALRIAALAGLLLTVGSSGLFAQQRVGINGAVNPDARGTPPGAQTRRLVIGQDVVFNEHITTGPAGQTQVLFLDESSMSVGPNSDLTIDQFVYDPKTGTGKLAMSATRGLMRYVGGKLSKQDDAVTLRTGTATLAVRGGAFIADIAADRSTDALFIYGKSLRVTGLCGKPPVPCGEQDITRPGFHSITSLGGQPSAPAPEPPGRLTQLLAQLDGRSGGTGGAPVIPTDTTVIDSGVPQTISGNLAESVAQSTQNSGDTTVSPTPAAYNSPVNGSTEPVPIIAPVTPLPPQPIAIPPTPPVPPVTVTFAGRLKSTNGQGTARGFVDQSANGDLAYAGGTLVNGVFTGIFGNLGTISLPLGPGLVRFGPQGTSSSFGTFSGTSFLSADNSFFYANITPTGQPAQRLFVFGGTPVDPSFYQPTGSGLRPQANSNTRVFAFTVQPDSALQSNIPFVRSQAGGNLANATVSPLYVVAPPTTPIGDATTVSAARGLQASLAINGQGPNQQSTIAVTTGTFGALQSSGQPIFNGQMRGSSLLSASGTPVRLGSAVSSTVDGNANSLYGSNTISGFVLDQTAFNSPSQGVVTTPIIPSTAAEVPLAGTPTTYGFAQPAVPAPVPSGVGVARTSQSLSGGFGGLMYTTAQPVPYIVAGGTLISTDAPNNRIQANLIGGTLGALSPSAGVNTLTMQYGGLTGTAGAQAFIDNNTFAAAENPAASPQSTGYFVSSGAAGTSSTILPSGVSYCKCQYLQWGYWGGDLQMTGPTVSRIDRAHINTWVAGVATPLSDINSLIGQSATASYTGHAIGSVFNNGQSYLAAGGFAANYNFGTQSGTLAINNFDGHNFAATGKTPLTGASYTFRSATGGFTFAGKGTFYGPMAAETGGNFGVASTPGVGPSYLASGIFASKR